MSKRSGHVYVKTASGLLIPFRPPALDPMAAAERQAERADEPGYLLTTPNGTYEGRVEIAFDGEPELRLERVDCSKCGRTGHTAETC